MVKITYPPQDPTLEAMQKAMEARAAKEPRRTYLGASGIGHECSRKLWYGLNGTPRKPIPYNNLAAIEDGHRTEELVAERLRLVDGIKLYTHREDGSQYGFDWGFLKGHYDGVIVGLLQAPATPHIWENKTVNDKKFTAFKKAVNDYGEKQALQQWDGAYYAQAVIYMHAEELTRHYLTVTSPGGREIASCRTEANPKMAEALIAKAKRIHAAKEPPERIGGKDYYICKWCEFYEVCYA